MLLISDNFEHLLVGSIEAVELVSALVQAAPLAMHTDCNTYCVVELVSALVQAAPLMQIDLPGR